MTIRELFERPTAARVAIARYLIAADKHGIAAVQAMGSPARRYREAEAALIAERAARAEILNPEGAEA